MHAVSFDVDAGNLTIKRTMGTLKMGRVLVVCIAVVLTTIVVYESSKRHVMNRWVSVRLRFTCMFANTTDFRNILSHLDLFSVFPPQEGVAHVAVFNSSATWAATFFLRGYKCMLVIFVFR